MSTRREVRKGFSQQTRITLLEDDADTQEADIKGVTRLLVAFLISVTLASLGLAAKVVFG